MRQREQNTDDRSAQLRGESPQEIWNGKKTNLCLLHLRKEENFRNYHQVMSPSMSRPINRQLDVCMTYVSTATRPDISAAVGVLSQYMSRPSNDHWIGVKHVLRYLKGTLKYGLKFTAHEEEPELFGHSDADWTGDVDARRSTSGYVFQIGSSTVSWSSGKQATVAKSLRKLNMLL